MTFSLHQGGVVKSDNTHIIINIHPLAHILVHLYTCTYIHSPLSPCSFVNIHFLKQNKCQLKRTQDGLVNLDDTIMLKTNKMERKSFVIVISYSLTEEKNILVSLYLYINENYYKDILTSI